MPCKPVGCIAKVSPADFVGAIELAIDCDEGCFALEKMCKSPCSIHVCTYVKAEQLMCEGSLAEVQGSHLVQGRHLTGASGKTNPFRSLVSGKELGPN